MRFSSIVFTVENKEKRQEILKQKEILITGTATKVVKYLKVPSTTQCISYQKFGYIGDRCSTRACGFCAAVYLFKDHSCSTCIITGKPYKHTTPLCINCKEKHFTNSEDYKTFKPAKPYCTRLRRRGWKHHLESVPLDGQVQRRWQRAVAACAARCRCDSVVLSPRRVHYPQ